MSYIVTYASVTHVTYATHVTDVTKLTMFTGIIEETGTVQRIKPTARSIELTFRVRLCARGVKIGDSLAVNGCCLTAVYLAARGKRTHGQVDLLQATWRPTTLRFARVGSLVNLERALPPSGRLSGHFVTGHIDGTGRIERWERQGPDHLLEISAPAEL